MSLRVHNSKYFKLYLILKLWYLLLSTMLLFLLVLYSPVSRPELWWGEQSFCQCELLTILDESLLPFCLSRWDSFICFFHFDILHSKICMPPFMSLQYYWALNWGFVWFIWQMLEIPAFEVDAAHKKGKGVMILDPTQTGTIHSLHVIAFLGCPAMSECFW